MLPASPGGLAYCLPPLSRTIMGKYFHRNFEYLFLYVSQFLFTECVVSLLGFLLPSQCDNLVLLM